MVRGRRKTRVGRVVSDKMDKTVVVVVEWRQTHPLYSKSVKRFTKFHAHDEDNGSKVGDMVGNLCQVVRVQAVTEVSDGKFDPCQGFKVIPCRAAHPPIGDHASPPDFVFCQVAGDASDVCAPGGAYDPLSHFLQGDIGDLGRE